MNPAQQHLLNITRRELFQRAGTGIGAVALASLLNEEGSGRADACWEAINALEHSNQPLCLSQLLSGAD